MFVEIIVFLAGLTVGVLFRDQIVGFKARAANAYDAATRAFRQ